MKTKTNRRKPARAGRRTKRAPPRRLRAKVSAPRTVEGVLVEPDKRDDELSDEESLDREEKQILY